MPNIFNVKALLAIIIVPASLIPAFASQVKPIGHWTFEAGNETIDQSRNFDSLIMKGAFINDGMLYIDSGKQAMARGYTGPDIYGNKTLIVWLKLLDLKAQSGVPMSIHAKGRAFFDGLMYSGPEHRKWRADSDMWNRSKPLEYGYEEHKTDARLKIALVHQSIGNDSIQVSFYRNDTLLGQYDILGSHPYYTGSTQMVFGQVMAGKWIRCAIEEAMLFNHSLSGRELKELKPQLVNSNNSSFWKWMFVALGFTIILVLIKLKASGNLIKRGPITEPAMHKRN